MNLITDKIFIFLRKLYNLRVKRIIILVFWLGSIQMQGQNIFVYDSKDHEPLGDVFVIGPNETTLTNPKGKAKLASKLNESDSITFQHPAFETLNLSFYYLQKNQFIVYLERKIVDLDILTISAHKWEQKAEDLPLRVQSIHRDALFFQPPTTADLIGNSGDVFIQKSQQGGGSPMIRGFAANRILLVYEGQRVNNAIFRSGNLQNIILFDANAMESAEVVFGPGSTIYGSDALGGVIDFRTFEPQFQNDSSLAFYGQAKAGYASASNELNGHVHFGLSGSKWSSFTSASVVRFDDLVMGSNGPDEYLRLNYVIQVDQIDTVMVNPEPKKQISSGYNQLNFIQKVGLKINEYSTLTLGVHWAQTSDIPRYDRLILESEDGLTNAEWYYGPQQWLNANLNFENNKAHALYSESRIILGYQLMKESRHDRKFGNSTLRNRDERVDAITLNMDLNKVFSEKVQLFYGLEGIFNHVQSNANKTNILTRESEASATRYPDGSQYASGGLYALVKWKPSVRWTLSGGLRYSSYWLNGAFDTTYYNFEITSFSQSTAALTPSLGGVFKPSEKVRIYANIGQGFRAPNIDDVAKVFDSAPGKVVVPNPNLNPENVASFDLGFDYTPSSMIRIEVSGFYSLLSDVMVIDESTLNGTDSIVYDDELSAIQSLQNVGSGWITGAQAGIIANLSDRFSIKGNITYTRGKDENQEALRHVTPLFGSFHIEYVHQHFRLDLNTQASGAIAYDDLAPSERDKPHLYAKDEMGQPYSPQWVTINLNGSWFITQKIRFNVGVENILDARYRTYSSGIAAPGRNFLAALVVLF